MKTAQKLALNYATRPYIRSSGLDAANELADELRKEGYLGDDPVTVVLVSGHQPGRPGKTDNIQVRTLE